MKGFHKSKASTDGYDPLCRKCRNAYVRRQLSRTGKRGAYIPDDDGPSMDDVRRQEAQQAKQRARDNARITAAYAEVRPVWSDQ